MIKRRELQECGHLFEYLSHPSVFPFVRQKATSSEEFLFMTKQLMEEEERGEVISRTITDDFGMPIGTINLYDIQDQAGFLGTWIGQPFQGKGYNLKAKNLFLEELFYQYQINTVFLRIKKHNEKPIRATEKLAYTMNAKESHLTLMKKSMQENINMSYTKFQKIYSTYQRLLLDLQKKSKRCKENTAYTILV